MGYKIPPPYIFISYARVDGKEYAEKLQKSLLACGYKVFFDVTSIIAGTTFTTEIEEALTQATQMIVVLTPGSNISEWVHAEVTHFRNQHKPVIPVYFQDVTLLNLLFVTRQYVDFRSEGVYKKSFENLVRDIEWLHDQWKTRPFIELGVHIDQAHLLCIGEDALVSDAKAIMDASNFEIRHLVVTDTGHSGGKLRGLISLRLILKNEQKELAHLAYGIHVSEVMMWYAADRDGPPKPTFNYLRTDDDVSTVLKQFLEELTKAPGADHTFYMSALPIVDQDNRAVGIVSFKDICRAIRTKSQDLPLPATVKLKDIMKTPRTSVPKKAVSAVKMELIKTGQRDAFIVNEYGDLLGMIPDEIIIKNELFIERVASDRNILVPYKRLQLQLADTSVLDMLEPYTTESRLYYYFAVVELSNTQTPPKLLGAVSYLEVFKLLLGKC